MTLTLVKAIVVGLLLGRTLTLAQLTIPETVIASKEKAVYLPFIDDASPLPLDRLVDQSNLVILATLRNERAYLSPDQRRIFTDYEVRPVRLLFDRSATGTIAEPVTMSPLILTMFGGKLEIGGKVVWLDDTARLTWDQGAMLLLFLKRDPAGNGRYVLAGGIAGLFRLNDEQRVRSLLRHGGDDADIEYLLIDEVSKRIDALSR